MSWSSTRGPFGDPPPGKRCDECDERPATIRWGTELEVTHGMFSWRCRVCALEAQVEHARERAAALPELERRLWAARETAAAERDRVIE